MVLNMADLCKFRESFQTPEKYPMCSQMDFQLLSRMLVKISDANANANAFPSTFENVCEDFGWITKGSKLADFDQKAHGFEDGGLG